MSDRGPTSYGNSRYVEIDRETTADLRDRIRELEIALREANEKLEATLFPDSEEDRIKGITTGAQILKAANDRGRRLERELREALDENSRLTRCMCEDCKARAILRS